MGLSLKELYDTLLGRSGYSGAYLSYASLKQLAAQAINMYAIRTTTLPADAGADYNAGYTSCTVHTVSNPTLISLKEYDDTYVTHMASGYAARQTITACYCESRTPEGCDCENRDYIVCDCQDRDNTCLAHSVWEGTCGCNIDGCLCDDRTPPTYPLCTCEVNGACLCNFDTVTCECNGRTNPPECVCDDRTTVPTCTCDDRCRCNTVDLYTCPSNT